jgi:hypothetical protein
MKKIPKRLQKVAIVHNATVHIAPHGYEYGITNPESIQFVCTIRDQCFAEFLGKYRMMENNYLDILEKFSDFKKKVKDLLMELKTIGAVSPILLAHKEVERELEI